MFITLEGIEGSGKSTQARLLADRLRAAGRFPHLTREPGGTPLAGAIRALLLRPNDVVGALVSAGLASPDTPVDHLLPVTEALLLSAARAQHVACIREWLAAGEVVICDRFADSTRAYQGAARGLDDTTLTALEGLATGGLRPDHTLLFDLPVTTGLARRRGAVDGEWNRLDAEQVAFHERVRTGYLALAAAEPQRWVIFDASVPSDQLAERVWADVSGWL